MVKDRFEKLAATAPQFSGVEIVLHGLTFVVPGLSLGDMRRHRAALDEFKEAKSLAWLDVMQKVEPLLLAALKRNYSKITADDLGELIDAQNFLPVWQAVLGQSGLKLVQPGESKPAAA